MEEKKEKVEQKKVAKQKVKKERKTVKVSLWLFIVILASLAIIIVSIIYGGFAIVNKNKQIQDLETTLQTKENQINSVQQILR